MTDKTLAIVGARGYVGQELLRILRRHSGFELAWASSREKQGQPLSADVPGLAGDYVVVAPKQLTERSADVYVLALPNGLAAEWVAAIATLDPAAVVLDLSADYRFDADWTYGLTELRRSRLNGALRISNPGCYATAMQLALAPFQPLGISNIHCFGVSGYSGAGTRPSAHNNPRLLHDNLRAYGLVNHMHEREVSHQLQQPVYFMPSVAGFFRGIQMTVSCQLDQPLTLAEVNHQLERFYYAEARISTSASVPDISMVRNTADCCIGGAVLSNDGQRLVLVSVLDNLLKGAASQAIQNLNLACGFDEQDGLNND